MSITKVNQAEAEVRTAPDDAKTTPTVSVDVRSELEQPKGQEPKSRRKLVIGIAVALVAAAVVFANLYFRRGSGPAVTVELIKKRDLEAIVSASGKIQAKRQVQISADTIGRVTRLAVEEGDRVKSGQFLLQIDPEALESALQRGDAAQKAAREALQQARAAVESARANLNLARQNVERQRALYRDELVSREVLDRAESELKVRETELEVRQAEVRAAEQRLAQEAANLRRARYDLSKVTIDAPIDGVITRLNIEEGETVLIGTMNNPGTVLMIISDLSVIEAQIEVDETDIVDVRMGQPAKVTIDAFPDRELGGKVTKIGASSLQPTAAQAATARQATNFEVLVQLEGEIPQVRPGFTCTADITTATRSQAVAVPIQALTVRDLTYNEKGELVREPRDKKKRGRTRTTTLAELELPPGHTRKETEGVFVERQGSVEFRPIQVGIAGEKYFEVLSGLAEGDRVVTGPFSSVRELQDGDPVKLEEPKRATR
jgi:HlyD family secretion protein